MEEKLNSIESETRDILSKSHASVDLTRQYLEILKEHVIKHPFSAEEEEIYFFKEIKPRFYSWLIYFTKIHKLHLKRPTGGNDSLKLHLQKQLERIRQFFEDNQDFYQYHRNQSSYLDRLYFKRGNHDIQFSIDSFDFEKDARFSTIHDFTVAKILAHELLEAYLKKELDIINRNGDSSFSHSSSSKTKLQWTESKTDLIELIYALHAIGALNHGKADIKEIVAVAEEILNIKLGDVYTAFKQIKMRKNEQTKFLDTLTQFLQKRIDESE